MAGGVASQVKRTDKPIAAVPPGGGYACTRCGRKGHVVKFCPTLNDPSYDQDIRLQNIPKTTRLKVTNLENVDTTNKTVIHTMYNLKKYYFLIMNR